ncbi:MAG: hypothetical protein J6Q58_00550, partial [Clostridia bacterium]|nr:hypothetical protein [Clostridia bacterium]
KKNINGRITAVTILSEKKKALTLKSAWIIKNKQHISPTVDVQAPTITSKTRKSMNTVYSNSILNTEEKVNNNSKNSSDTIKYSKKSRTSTDGQVQKKLANYTNLKVYSKTETEKIINTIIEGNLGTDSLVIDVSGKTKNQAIDMLWNELNTAPKGKQLSSALKLADYIIENSVVEDLFSEEINAENINTLAT